MSKPVAVLNQFSEHGVHPLNARTAELRDAKWDDLKTFLAVADQGSFRAAAGALGTSVNTVRARIERIEARFGYDLLNRTTMGVELTFGGRRIAEMVREMRGASYRAGNWEEAALVRPGELRIGASEAVGSGWLTPRLADLNERLPELTVSLFCEYDLERDDSSELDIGLSWSPPSNPNLIVSRLATAHFMFFASKTYLEKHGHPKSVDDLLEHRFIEQVAPGVKSDVIDLYVGLWKPTGFIPLRTNSSLALYYAVANGAGIALMPTYAAAISRQLIPLDIDFRLRFDLLYYYHPEAKRSGPVRETIDWLKDSFDPVKYPFFDKNFVHPTDFLANREANIVPLFESFV